MLSHPLSLARTNWSSHGAPLPPEGEPLEGGCPSGTAAVTFLPPVKFKVARDWLTGGAVLVGEGGGRRFPDPSP